MQAAEQGSASPARGIEAIFGPTVNAILAPSKAFETLKEKPLRALWVVLWVMVLTGVASFLSLDVTRQFMRIGFVESLSRGDRSMDPEQARRVLETMDRWAPLATAGQNLFMVVLIGVIAVMLWAGSSMLGGSVRFANSFAVASVAAVVHPAMAGLFMATAWQMDPPQIRRMADIPAAVPSLGLDLLLGSEGMSMVARTFLMRMDLFNLWWGVLIVMGARSLLRLKKGGAIGLAFVIWLITAGTGALLSGMNA